MESILNIRDQNGVQSAPIVIYVPGEEQVVSDLPLVPSAPKKPRALVYQFFEWEQELARYKCILCGKTYAIPKSGGTGSLNNHMIRKHQSEFGTAKKTKSENDDSAFSF